MKRVLLTSCAGLGKGGIQTVIMSIVRELHQEYIFDIILFTNDRRYYDDEFESYGGHIFRISPYDGESSIKRKLDYFVRRRRIYRETKKIIQKYGPYQAIHCNNDFESGVCLKAAYEAGIPRRIIQVHMIHSFQEGIKRLVNKMSVRLISKYATDRMGCSEEACLSLFHDCEYSVIDNPFDNDKYQFTPLEQSANINIVQVGTFSAVKNQIFTLDTFSYIKKKIGNAKLSLIGATQSDYTEQLIRDINMRDEKDSIVVLPFDADIKRELARASIFMFPSLREGFGISLIEAQSVGVKCFASDSVPSNANAGGVTYLSLSSGAEAWAEKILEYIESGVCHDRWDCSRFNKSYFVNRIKQYYE